LCFRRQQAGNDRKKSDGSGLNGRADFQKSGKSTLKSLDCYVPDRVLTHGKQSQVSIAHNTITDFSIALTVK
jgi:hypothetical protein